VSSADRAAFVEHLEDRFEEARAAGAEDLWIDFAHRPVLIQAAGEGAIDALLPALAHLRIGPADRAALTIRAWDSDSTGTPPPVAPWKPDAYRQYGLIRGYTGDGFFAAFDGGTRSLNVVDRPGGAAYHWTNNVEDFGMYGRSAPFRTLFNLWLSGGDTQLVHGAAVGHPSGCVLLIGPSGAGKSSTALSCLGSPLQRLRNRKAGAGGRRQDPADRAGHLELPERW
jgi:hypothetical protein